MTSAIIHRHPSPGRQLGAVPADLAPLDLLAPAHLGESDMEPETAFGLPDARIVWADEAAIRQVYPSAATARVATWLLDGAAWISGEQQRQATVNTPIRVDGRRRTLFRPPGYGRALISVLPDGGMLDIKGAGTGPGQPPRFGLHANGLLCVSAALCEVLYERLIASLFQRAGAGFTCVPSLAVLDLGFDLLGPDGRRTPAGMLVRAACLRPGGGQELPLANSPQQEVALEIELLLRHFGVTSDSPSSRIHLVEEDGRLKVRYGPTWLDDLDEVSLAHVRALSGFAGAPMDIAGVNIQLTRHVALHPSRACLVDFGHFNVQKRFDVPVLSLVCDRPLRWGGLLSPGDPRFVQPRPALAVPWELWGTPDASDHTTPLRPRVQQICIALADRFRAGTAGRDDVEAGLQVVLEAST